MAGPSGCGKSTLIRALNGLIPTRTRRPCVDRSASAACHRCHALKGLATVVGTVLQDPSRQLVASTVPAELTFGPENLGVDRDEIGRASLPVWSRPAVSTR